MGQTYLETFQKIAAQVRQLSNRFEADALDLVIEANNQLVNAYEERIRQLETELNRRPIKVMR